jgi:hypothetical protein
MDSTTKTFLPPGNTRFFVKRAILEPDFSIIDSDPEIPVFDLCGEFLVKLSDVARFTQEQIDRIPDMLANMAAQIIKEDRERTEQQAQDSRNYHHMAVNVPDREYPGYVYVIHETEDIYKVGITCGAVETRRRHLQIGTHHALTTIYSCLVPDAPDLEQEFHLKFADVHVRGEWFRLTESDIDNIKDRCERVTADFIVLHGAAPTARRTKFPNETERLKRYLRRHPSI